ncbi:MAG: carbon monoxide dehydrogenase subunit G [Gemmatimonadales bacterium]|nr:carbon monoxide dehydrogenase subunit G [Gemmatimonadales bacterium]MBP9199412.1 carbon monoxide dehydrogenase subunit G [Gemmatimonadales bacterium]
MKMSFSGAPEVLAPLAHVWPRLLDPHFVARHGPGVESVEVLDPHHFKVLCGFGVGSIKLRFGLDVELSNVNPPNYFAMKVRGKAPGSAVEVTADLALEPIDADRTRLRWTAESEISGTVASVGARLMEGTARKLTEQFWTRFAASLGEAGSPPEPAPLSPDPSAPPAPPPPDAPATEPPAPA